MSTSGQPRHTSVVCAEFYRPVVIRLQDAGLEPLGRYYPPHSDQDFHSGWRGRWRSFRSGYENQGLVYYCEVGIAPGQNSCIGLDIRHPDYLMVSELLYSHIRRDFDGISLTTKQATDGNDGSAFIWIPRLGTVWDSAYHQEGTRVWMSATLIDFRDRMQLSWTKRWAREHKREFFISGGFSARPPTGIKADTYPNGFGGRFLERNRALA